MFNNYKMKSSKKRRKAKNRLSRTYSVMLRAHINKIVNDANSSLDPERQIPLLVAFQVAGRDLRKTRKLHSDVRMFSAARAVSAHINLAAAGKETTAALENSDLLPVGHPSSTKQHAMTASALRHSRARWIAADPTITDPSAKALVASALSLYPGSTDARHAFARIEASEGAVMPPWVKLLVAGSHDALTAALGIGGNSSAARRLRAQTQRRDRYGKFAFMGGGLSFTIKIGDIFKTVSGKVVGMPAGGDGDLVEVEVRGSRDLEGGIYTVNSGRGTSSKAILDDDALPDSARNKVGAKDSEAYDVQELIKTKKTAPAELKKKKSKAGVTTYMTDDGYKVIETDDGDFGREIVVRREVGGSQVGKFDNFADAMDAIGKDSDNYDKYLKTPQGQAELRSGKWDVSVVGDDDVAPPDDSAEPMDLDPAKNITSQVAEAVRDGRQVRFNYNGKERVLEPQKISTGEKSEKRNLLGKDADGNTKAFTLDKIEAPSAKAQPDEKDIEVPDNAIMFDPAGDLDVQLKNAIEKQAPLAFMYSDKVRVFDPAVTKEGKPSYWKNPKNGNINLVGTDRATGEKKNFTLSKIQKLDKEESKATPDTDTDLQNVIDEINEIFDTFDGGGIDASEALDRLGDAIADVPNNDKIYGDLKRQVENIELRDGEVERSKSEAEKSIRKNATEEGAVPYLDPIDDEKENAEEKKVEDFVQGVADNIFRVMDDTEESFTDDEIRDQINDFLEDNDDAPADPDKEDLLVRVKEEVARQVQMAKDDDDDEAGIDRLRELEDVANDVVKDIRDNPSPDDPMTSSDLREIVEEAYGEENELSPDEVSQVIKRVNELLDDKDEADYDPIDDEKEKRTKEALESAIEQIDGVMDDPRENDTVEDDMISDTAELMSDEYPTVDREELIKRLREYYDKGRNENHAKEVFDDISNYPGDEKPDANEIRDIVKTYLTDNDLSKKKKKIDDIVSLVQKMLDDDDEAGYDPVDGESADDIKSRAAKQKMVADANKVSKPEGGVQIPIWLADWAADYEEDPDGLAEEVERMARDANKYGAYVELDSDLYNKLDPYQGAWESEAFVVTFPKGKYTPEEAKQILRGNGPDSDDLGFFEGTYAAHGEALGEGNFVDTGSEYEWAFEKLTGIDPYEDYVSPPKVIEAKSADDANDTIDKLIFLSNYENTPSGPDKDSFLEEFGTDLGAIRFKVAKYLNGENLITDGTRVELPDGRAATFKAGPRGSTDDPIWEITDSDGTVLGRNIASEEKQWTFDDYPTKATDASYEEYIARQREEADNEYENLSPDEYKIFISDKREEGRVDIGPGMSSEEIRKIFVEDWVDGNSLSKEDWEEQNIGTDVPGTPEAEDEQLQSVLSEEFDSMFELPEGGYKVKIFDGYEPQGRTDEESSDYTDDPSVLAQKFTKEEIARALAEAVLPDDDNGVPASGRGTLEFDEGDETVAAEALYEALSQTDMDADMILAGIYDSMLDPDRPRTNLENIQSLRDDMNLGPDKSRDLEEIMPKITDPDNVVKDAEARNRELGRPDRAKKALDLSNDYDEQNQEIVKIADRLVAAEDEGLGFDAGNLPDMFRDYLPMATSSNEEERQAFSGFWGMLMSLDGGSSGPGTLGEDVKSGDGFRSIVYKSLLDLNGGDEGATDDAYEELIENYGGMDEFVKGKEEISNGSADLDSGSTAANFYRLVTAASRPNTQQLYRAIGVPRNDPLFEKYTTEGSVFGMDARSFTATNVTQGTDSLMFTPRAGEQRIIFSAAPGEADSIEAANFSVFAGENEHFGYGNFEVVSVKEVDNVQSKLSGKKDIVVEIRRVAPASAGTDETKTYDDIQDWERITDQLGSNPGGTYRAPDGKEYYVKVPRSPSHAQNEALASSFYKELGINAIEISLGSENGELRIVSPMAENSSADFGDKLDDKEYVDKLKEGFAIDAWLANWDVVGLVYDNVITDSEGNPLRVDPGGSLLWRARGLPKGDAFGDQVNELDTFRDPDLNQQSASVFGSMTDEEVRASAEKLLEITPQRIDEIVDSLVSDPKEAQTLKTRLKRRREFILEREGLIPELTARPLDNDGGELERPELPDNTDDEAAMKEYKDKLAEYEVSKVVAEVWDCTGGDDGQVASAFMRSLTAAGTKKCTVPTTEELVAKVNADTAEATPDVKKDADTSAKDVVKFIDDIIAEEDLKATQKSRLEKAKQKISEINKKIQSGKISKKAAIDELNDLADGLETGGDSEFAITMQTVQDIVVDMRKILDGTINDRPPDKNLPPPGSGKGYAKDGTTFLVPGMRVRTKWGYAGTVDRYDKNSWQVWVTMDIDPGGKFAPGEKKMSFATTTLNVINQGDANEPWLDAPGVPAGKKPQGGLKYKPTKFAGVGKKAKEEAAKAAEAAKKKRPKGDAPEGAKVLPEVSKEDKKEKKLKPKKEKGPTGPVITEPNLKDLRERFGGPDSEEPKPREDGTGVLPVAYDKPVDFSVSEIEGVPSLLDVIEEVTREDSTTKSRKSKGLSSAVDGGDIEDLEVSVDEVINEVEGTKSTRLTFKLTSWAVADHYSTSMLADDPAWQKEGNYAYLPTSAIDPDTGAVVEYPEKVKSRIVEDLISKYVYTHSSGATASVHIIPGREGTFGSGKKTLANTVRIDIPEGTEVSNEVLTEILAAVGVRDPRPATREDFEILAENRAISVLGRDNNNPNKNVAKKEDREKLLDSIRKEYGFDAKDIKIVQSATGRIEVRVPPEVAKKIAEKTEIETLRHSFNMHGYVGTQLGPNNGYSYFDQITPQYAQIAASGIADILTGVNNEGGSLKSSRRRFMRGIKTTGQSSHEDIVEGEGGDYVFFNPSWNTDGQIQNGAKDNMHVDMNFDPAVVFERLDFYANSQDNGYGKRQDVVKDIVKESKIDGYEVMFKGAVTFEGLRSIVVGEQVRPALIEELKKRGVTEINGEPIEDIILFAGRGLQQDPQEIQRQVDEMKTAPKSDLENYWVNNNLTTTDGMIKYPESKTVFADLLSEIDFEVPEYLLSDNSQRLIGISPDAQKMVFRNEDSGEITVLNVGTTINLSSGGTGKVPPWTVKMPQGSDGSIANRFEDKSFVPTGKIDAVAAGLNMDTKLVNTDDFLEAIEMIELSVDQEAIDEERAIALLANMLISGVSGDLAEQPNPMHYMSVVTSIKKLTNWEELLRELLSSGGLGQPLVSDV